MKTIFYKKSNDANGDFWFNNIPYKEYFVLKNMLYQHDENINKYITDGESRIKIFITNIEDEFTHNGITRRIGLK